MRDVRLSRSPKGAPYQERPCNAHYQLRQWKPCQGDLDCGQCVFGNGQGDALSLTGSKNTVTCSKGNNDTATLSGYSVLNPDPLVGRHRRPPYSTTPATGALTIRTGIWPDPAGRCLCRL